MNRILTAVAIGIAMFVWGVFTVFTAYIFGAPMSVAIGGTAFGILILVLVGFDVLGKGKTS